MKKLSFEELSELADSVTEMAVLEQISGGTNNDCHDDPDPQEEEEEEPHYSYSVIGLDTIIH